MTPEEELTEEIKLRCFDDMYIDRPEEKEILQKAISLGVTVDEARVFIRSISLRDGYVVESELDQTALDLMKPFAENDGKITQKEFENAVKFLLNMSKNKVTKSELDKKVKTVIVDNGFKVKEGMLNGGKWFTTI